MGRWLRRRGKASCRRGKRNKKCLQTMQQAASHFLPRSLHQAWQPSVFATQTQPHMDRNYNMVLELYIIWSWKYSYVKLSLVFTSLTAWKRVIESKKDEWVNGYWSACRRAAFARFAPRTHLRVWTWFLINSHCLVHVNHWVCQETAFFSFK